MQSTSRQYRFNSFIQLPVDQLYALTAARVLLVLEVLSKACGTSASPYIGYTPALDAASPPGSNCWADFDSMSSETAAPELFQVDYVSRSGERVIVTGITSSWDADLVRDVFAIKEALDAGRDLDSLPLLHPYGRPRQSLSSWFAADDKLHRLSWPKLAAQLQECAYFSGAEQGTLLHGAAVKQDLPALQLLAAAAPDAITAGDLAGYTPVHYAACYSLEAALELLLRLSPAAILPDCDGRCPVAEALQQPASPTTALLLEAAAVTAAAEGKDALELLHHAMQNQQSAGAAQIPPPAPTAATVRGENDMTLLHRAAVRPTAAAVQLLLAAGLGDPMAQDFQGRTPLTWAATNDRAAAIEALVAAAPETAWLADKHQLCPVMHAIANNSLASLRVLLAAAPEGLAPGSEHGQEILHMAAYIGSAAMVRLVVDSAPHLVMTPDGSGQLALHVAALQGDAEVVQVLLAAAPEAAQVAARDGQTALHIAARVDSPTAIRLLIDAAPGAARASDCCQNLPLHRAADGGTLETVQLLLDAAPDTAAAIGHLKRTPLHCAAQHGGAEAARLLAAAAPEAAGMRDSGGCTPLASALQAAEIDMDDFDAVTFEQRCLATARILLSYGSVADNLAALAAAGQLGQPLYADLVAARLPLADSEWAQLPQPCPGLGRALPAALEHSVQQAQQLVRRLPAVNAQLLRCGALALARAQRAKRVTLPPPIVQHILSLVLSS